MTHETGIESARRAWTRSLCGALLAAVALCGISVQIVRAHRETRLEDLQAFRRFWSDLTVAIESYLASRQPDARVEAGDPEPAYRAIVIDRARVRGLGIANPLNTIRANAFFPHRRALTPNLFDDPGRAALLGYVFRRINGVAPFMVFWLAPLVLVPVSLALFITCVRAHQAGIAAVFCAWLVLAPFVAETLALARNTVGFYLIAVLLLVAGTMRSVFGRVETPPRLLLRALISGIFVAFLAWCRSSVAICLPGFLLHFAVAAIRQEPGGAAAWRRIVLTSLAFLAPVLGFRDTRQHDVWLAAWEGLGDFDRKYDHTWSDPAAERIARAHGAPSLRSRESERAFKDVVISRIAGDPAWFADILVKRFLSTLTLWKLWPYGPTDGEFIQRSTSPNEGFIDKYFTYTSTADHLGFAPEPIEVRAGFLAAPLFLYLVGAAVFRRRNDAWRHGLVALVCVGAGVLGLPVLMTTAGGQETQCAIVLHVLAAGLLLQRALNAARGVRT